MGWASRPHRNAKLKLPYLTVVRSLILECINFDLKSYRYGCRVLVYLCAKKSISTSGGKRQTGLRLCLAIPQRSFEVRLLWIAA